MPQKYRVTLPDGGEYEIEQPDAAPRSGMGQVGDFGTAAVKTAGSDFKNMAVEGTTGFASPIGMLKHASTLFKPITPEQMAGFKKFAEDTFHPSKEALIRKATEAAVGKDANASMGTKAGTLTGHAVALLGPGALMKRISAFLSGVGKVEEGLGAAGAATKTAGEMAQEMTTQTWPRPQGPPIQPAGPIRVPVRPPVAGFGSTTPPAPGAGPIMPQMPLSTPPPAAPPTVAGFGSSGMRVPTVGQGPAMPIRVPTGVSVAPKAAPVAASAEANAAAKAEQAAEGHINPALGRPDALGVYTGAERRGAARVSSEVEDKAFKQVRAEIERKKALDRARAALIRVPAKTKKSPPVAAPATPAAPAANAAHRAELLKEMGKSEAETGATLADASQDKSFFGKASEIPPKPGFTKTPTVSLADMKAKYGAADAAKRAGMTVDELEARIVGGTDPEKVAAALRQRVGAEKAARALGTKVEKVRTGPSLLPDRAVEGINAAIAKKLAAGEALTDKETSVLARIKSERGQISKKVFIPVAGAAVGGAAAPVLFPGGDDNEKVGKAGVGALAGLGAGLALTHPSAALRTALKARTEGFLSGGAIPKNIMTAAGAPFSEALETGNMKPIKELFRLPTNMKVYRQAVKHPAASNKYGTTAGPLSKRIGAIDSVATKILERGGTAPENISRHLLTGDRQLFGGMKLGPAGKAAVDIGYPFQRVPANVFAETAENAGRTLGVKVGNKGVEFAPRAKGAIFNPDMKTAMDIGSVGGGYALGEWAKGDPKKLYLAQIAMAALGSRTGLGTMGMMAKVGRQAVGGISPIPEQNADLKSWVGWPPTGVKAFKKLFGGGG